MVPMIPHNIKIKLAPLKNFFLRPDDAKSLPCWLSQLNWSKEVFLAWNVQNNHLINLGLTSGQGVLDKGLF